MLLLLSMLCGLAAAHWTDDAPLTSPADRIRQAEAQERAALVVEKDAEAPDVHVLLQETVLHVNADGSSSLRLRTVFMPMTAAAARERGTWQVSWDTWRQSRPTLEARVMQADGDVYQLDPKWISEQGASDNPLLLSDAKVLLAPLPQMEANAIVEEVVTYDSVQPLLPGQFYHRALLEDLNPIERIVVRLDAPRDMMLRSHLEGSDRAVSLKKKGERQVLELVLEDARALKGVPWSAPLSVPRYASLTLSTASDWAEVARAYDAYVAPQLDPAGLEALIEPLKGRSRDEIIAGALDAVVSRVRYTGVHFADARILPTLPNATVARGFGDCKDQAATLVAVLRAAGVPAHLALLYAGFPEGVPAELPTLGRFDHAIVYVPGPDARWLDPTQTHEGPSVPPENLQGRPALIIAPDTTALATIPFSAMNQSVWTESLTFTLPYRGAGTVTEIGEATGVVAALNRALDEGYPGGASARLSDRAKTVFEAEDGALPAPPPNNVRSGPWRSELRAEDAESATSYVSEAWVQTPGFHGTRHLPRLPGPRAPDDKDDSPRYPLEFTPYRYELVLTVQHPPEFEATVQPEKQAWTFGPVQIEREQTVAVGQLVIVVRVIADGGVLQPDDAEKLGTFLGTFAPWPANGLRFSHKAWAKINKDGDIAAALPMLRASVAAHPEDAVRRADLARAFMTAGLTEAAARELAPVAKAPVAEVKFLQAALLARDPYGRYLRGRFDRKGAIAAARAALELDPDHAEARDLLVDLLSRNEEGSFLGDGAEPCAAAEALKYVVVDHSDYRRAQQYIKLSLRCEDRSALVAWMDTMQGGEIPAGRATARILDEGTGPAIRDAQGQGLASETAQGLLKSTVWLMELGRYADARTVLEALGPMMPPEVNEKFTAYVDLLKKLETTEQPVAAGTPEGVLVEALRSLGTGREASLRPWVSTTYGLSEEGAMMGSVFAGQAKDEAYPPRVAIAAALAMSTYTTTPAGETGYRVAWNLAIGDKKKELITYLIPEKGKLKLLTVEQSRLPLANYAATLARKGDLANALTWLRWAVDPSWSDSSGRAPLQHLSWVHLLRLASVEQPASVEAAALALRLHEHATAADIKRLESLRDQLTTTEIQVQIDRSLVSAYDDLYQHDKAAAVTERLLVAFPGEPSLVLGRLYSLAHVHPDEVERALADPTAAGLDAEQAADLRARLSLIQGDYAAALAHFRADNPQDEVGPLNEWVWYALFPAEPPSDLATETKRFATKVGASDDNRQNTLASAEARSGNIRSAATRLQAALDSSNASAEDLRYWWIVRGLICEQLGEREAAIEAYRKAPPGPDLKQDLAKVRLAALGA